MLTAAALQEIAKDVLTRVLGKHGFDRAEIRFGEDHDGAQAILVDVYFREGSSAPPGDATIDAISGLAEALEDRGETRFPYLQPHFVGDEIGVE
jgi:hypothetical protein